MIKQLSSACLVALSVSVAAHAAVTSPNPPFKVGDKVLATILTQAVGKCPKGSIMLVGPDHKILPTSKCYIKQLKK